jgi:excisionase family DNA binding protein
VDLPKASECGYYSIKEFAYHLGVHPDTIRRGIRSGRIHGFRVGPGSRATYRIPKSEINRLALFDMEEMIERIIEKRKNIAE